MSSRRLSKLIKVIKSAFSSNPVVAELVESANTLHEINYVLMASGEGEIPSDLLDSTGFYDVTGNKPKTKPGPRRNPPTTGHVARRRHSSSRMQALNASSCNNHSVIKVTN